MRAVLLALCVGLLPRPGHCQRDLAVEQPADWYGLHVGLSTAALLTSVGISQGLTGTPQARWRTAPRFERGVEQNESPLSSRVSDGLLLTSLVVSPVGIALASDSWTERANAGLIHVETLATSLLLNTAVKHAVRRGRPFTHFPGQASATDASPTDRVLSFYSGHASLSMTSAVSGGVLVASTSSSLELRTSFWTTQFALTALVAHLRVRAGRHYPTDVLVGGLVGAAVGVGVPVAQQLDFSLEPEEGVGMAAGLTAGVLAGFVFPRRWRAAVLAAPVSVTALPRGGYLLEARGSF